MKLKQYMSAFLLSLFLTGCASFDGNLPETKTTHVSNKTVHVELELHRTLNGESKYKDNAALQQALANKLWSAFEKAGYSLAPKETADEVVYVKLNSDGTYNEIMSTITGLTLFIIPSTANDSFSINATIKTKNKEKTFASKDSVTTICQIFMLPFMPFKTLPNAENKTIDNMFNTLVFDINNVN